MSVLKDRLEKLIEPALLALGFELVLLEFSPGINTGTLRLFIDKPEGITMEDCTTASREIAALMDVEDPIQKAYHLEVSSPGLDRPLTKVEHFQRFAGEKVRISLIAPINKRKKFAGVLVSGNEVEVIIDVDGEQVHLPVDQIERARLVPDYAKEFAKAR